MIVFTVTLSLIIAAVVALAGVAASSGNTRSLGDDFVLSGHHLSSLSAGRLFLDGIVAGSRAWRDSACCPAPLPGACPPRDRGGR